MRITITRGAKVWTSGVPAEQLEQLKNGLASDESCLDYAHGEVAELGLEGGQIVIYQDADSKKWNVRTTYQSPTDLSESQIKKLVAYTTGQWSDGLGAGCFDPFCEQTGASIQVYPFRASAPLSVDVGPGE